MAARVAAPDRADGRLFGGAARGQAEAVAAFAARGRARRARRWPAASATRRGPRPSSIASHSTGLGRGSAQTGRPSVAAMPSTCSWSKRTTSVVREAWARPWPSGLRPGGSRSSSRSPWRGAVPGPRPAGRRALRSPESLPSTCASARAKPALRSASPWPLTADLGLVEPCGAGASRLRCAARTPAPNAASSSVAATNAVPCGLPERIDPSLPARTAGMVPQAGHAASNRGRLRARLLKSPSSRRASGAP